MSNVRIDESWGDRGGKEYEVYHNNNYVVTTDYHSALCVKSILERNDRLSEILQVLLDQVDYTSSNCRVNEMIGAILDSKVIDQARQALENK